MDEDLASDPALAKVYKTWHHEKKVKPPAEWDKEEYKLALEEARERVSNVSPKEIKVNSITIASSGSITINLTGKVRWP